MIKKKICLLGYFAVGKTSLVRQFILETFEEKYHTTIGVKIDKKEIELEDKKLQMLIWDIHGEDKFQKVQKSYLLGASGYFLVIDSTREESLNVVMELKRMVEEAVGNIPHLVLMNKYDLEDDIVVSTKQLVELGFERKNIIKTSAKTGLGVEEAFSELAKML